MDWSYHPWTRTPYFPGRSSMDNCLLPAENQVDKNDAIKISLENFKPEHLEASLVDRQTWHFFCKSWVTHFEERRTWERTERRRQRHLPALTALPQPPDLPFHVPTAASSADPGLDSRATCNERQNRSIFPWNPIPVIKLLY